MLDQSSRTRPKTIQGICQNKSGFVETVMSNSIRHECRDCAAELGYGRVCPCRVNVDEDSGTDCRPAVRKTPTGAESYIRPVEMTIRIVVIRAE